MHPHIATAGRAVTAMQRRFILLALDWRDLIRILRSSSGGEADSSLVSSAGQEKKMKNFRTPSAIRARSILGILWVAASAAASADTGWQQWTIASGGNDHWYNAISVNYTVHWTQAKDIAQAQGVYLSSIRSQAEQDFVVGLTGGMGNPDYWYHPQYAWPNDHTYGPWIGLLQDPQDMSHIQENWTWSSGESLAITNWAPDPFFSPSNGNPNQFYGAFVKIYGSSQVTWFNSNNDPTLSIGGANVGPNDHPIHSFILESNTDPTPEPATVAVVALGAAISYLKTRKRETGKP